MHGLETVTIGTTALIWGDFEAAHQPFQAKPENCRHDLVSAEVPKLRPV